MLRVDSWLPVVDSVGNLVGLVSKTQGWLCVFCRGGDFHHGLGEKREHASPSNMGLPVCACLTRFPTYALTPRRAGARSPPR